MEPIVSIIVPVYNCEKYLEECISSIINQTYQFLEIILIDDGATDRSGEICDSFAQQDSRILVKHNKNAGVGAARNCGIKSASGKYIVFIDSDDICHKDMILHMVNAAKKNEADLVICGIAAFVNYPKVEKKYVFPTKQISLNEYVEDVLLNVQTGQYCGGPYNKLFLKQIIDENNLNFETSMNYAEDFCFNLSYLKFVSKIYLMDELLYYYRLNALNSLTYRNYHYFDIEIYWKQRIFAYSRFEELFVKLGLKQRNSDKIEQLLKKYIISTVKMACKFKMPNNDIIEFVNTLCEDSFFKERINNANYLTGLDKIRIYLIRKKQIKILCYFEKSRYIVGKLIRC